MNISGILQHYVGSAIKNNWHTSGAEKKNRCLFLVALGHICRTPEVPFNASAYFHENTLHAVALGAGITALNDQLKANFDFEVTTPQQAQLVLALLSQVKLKQFFTDKMMTEVRPGFFAAASAGVSSRLALPAAAAPLAIEGPAAAAQPDALAVVRAEANAAPQFNIPNFLIEGAAFAADPEDANLGNAPEHFENLLWALANEARQLVVRAPQSSAGTGAQADSDFHRILEEKLINLMRAPFEFHFDGTPAARLQQLGIDLPRSQSGSLYDYLQKIIGIGTRNSGAGEHIVVEQNFGRRFLRALTAYFSSEDKTANFEKFYETAPSDLDFAAADAEDAADEAAAYVGKVGVRHAVTNAKMADVRKRELASALGCLELENIDLDTFKVRRPVHSLFKALSFALNKLYNEQSTPSGLREEFKQYIKGESVELLAGESMADRFGKPYTSSLSNFTFSPAAYKKQLSNDFQLDLKLGDRELAIIQRCFVRPIVLMTSGSEIRIFGSLEEDSDQPIFIYYDGKNYYPFNIAAPDLSDRGLFLMAELNGRNPTQKNRIYVEKCNVEHYALFLMSDLQPGTLERNKVYIESDDVRLYQFSFVSTLADVTNPQKKCVYLAIDGGNINWKLLDSDNKVRQGIITLMQLDGVPLEQVQSLTEDAPNAEDIKKSILNILLKQGYIGGIRYQLLGNGDQDYTGIIDFRHLSHAMTVEQLAQLNNASIESFQGVAQAILDAVFRHSGVSQISYKLLGDDDKVYEGKIKSSLLGEAACFIQVANDNIQSFRVVQSAILKAIKTQLFNKYALVIDNYLTSFSPEDIFKRIARSVESSYNIIYAVDASGQKCFQVRITENGKYFQAVELVHAERDAARAAAAADAAQTLANQPRGVERWDAMRARKFLERTYQAIRDHMVTMTKRPRGIELLEKFLFLGDSDVWSHSLILYCREMSGEVTAQGLRYVTAATLLHASPADAPALTIEAIDAILHAILPRLDHPLDTVKSLILSMLIDKAAVAPFYRPHEEESGHQGMLLKMALGSLVALASRYSFQAGQEFVAAEGQKEALNRLLNTLLLLTMNEKNEQLKEALFKVTQFYQALFCLASIAPFNVPSNGNPMSDATICNAVGRFVATGSVGERVEAVKFDYRLQIPLAGRFSFSPDDMPRVLAWETQRRLLNIVANPVGFQSLLPVSDIGGNVREFLGYSTAILPALAGQQARPRSILPAIAVAGMFAAPAAVDCQQSECWTIDDAQRFVEEKLADQVRDAMGNYELRLPPKGPGRT